MSVFEPQTTAAFAAGTEIDPPDFPVVVRGYDRQRVNAYLQSLVSRLAAEHDRATQAERAAANDQATTFEQLGAKAIKALELASQSGEALIEQAKERGEMIVQEAESQAADLLEEAKQQADRLHAVARGTLREAADERDRILAEASEGARQIRTLAEDDARATLEEAESASQHMWQKVREECTAMQVETARLQKLRDQTMEYLSHVRTELNSSLFVPLPEEPEPELTLEPDVVVRDFPDGVEATASADPELAASDDAAEPDPTLEVEPESGEAASAPLDGLVTGTATPRRSPRRRHEDGAGA
jgi:cell division septum initiation protein DivIVA